MSESVRDILETYLAIRKLEGYDFSFSIVPSEYHKKVMHYRVRWETDFDFTFLFSIYDMTPIGQKIQVVVYEKDFFMLDEETGLLVCINVENYPELMAYTPAFNDNEPGNRLARFEVELEELFNLIARLDKFIS